MTWQSGATSHEISEHLSRRLIYAVALDALRKPNKRLAARIRHAVRRFLWECAVRSPSALERLAHGGLDLATIPMELPDRRKLKDIPSPTRFRDEYRDALGRARKVFTDRRLRQSQFTGARLRSLSEAFPGTPRQRLEGHVTAKSIASAVVGARYHIGERRVRNLISSWSKIDPKKLVALERQALAIESISAVRQVLRSHSRAPLP